MNEPHPQQRLCPICAHAGFQAYKLGLVQCQSCTIVLSPAIWQANANERLEEEWFGADYPMATSFWARLFEGWNNRRTLAQLAKTDPPGRRLLEIGVGSGSFLQAARAQGYRVTGCDLSAPLCEQVRRAYGIAMHCGELAALKGEGPFDLVVANHVLEHVQQPVEFLRDIRRLLAPGGVAHIAVPNIDGWEATLPGWASFEPYHLTYFAPSTLTRVVSASGLVPDSITTHDSFSGWFLAFLRTLLGVNRDSGAVTRPAKSTLNSGPNRRSAAIEFAYRLAMLGTGAALWPLRSLQARLGFGDEAICIAHKLKPVGKDAELSNRA